MKNIFNIKGPLTGAFFILCLFILTNCASTKNQNNYFTKQQQANVEIFTVRDFKTHGLYQLFFDVFNKNENVSIGVMVLYVFDKDCDNVKDNETSNKIIKSNPAYIGPYQNGVITFLPGKRLKCYLVKGYEKY
ncbi:MAG: hypothetical protein VW228_02955 [Pelagibacteraceae bacterium]